MKTQRAGKFAGDCQICGEWSLLSKHHSKPSVNGEKPRGPIWLLCASCHAGIHARFTNKELCALTLEQIKSFMIFASISAITL